MSHRLLLCTALAAGGLAACTSSPPPLEGEPGTPVPGLTAEELERFTAGQELFNRGFTPEEGVGPLFNQDRCSSCHDLPTSGGTGVEHALKATRFSADGCDLLEDVGGDNIQQRTTPLLRARGILSEASPPEATARVRVMPPSLYGAGLIEAMPESVLRAAADPDDADGDGISGRLGVAVGGTVGRFGRKADFATVADFVRDAFLVEMGLTTPTHPEELRRNGEPLPPGVDPAPDPEISEDQLAAVVDYVRFLVPPAPETPANAAVRDTIARGERLFASIGCTGCHLPMLSSGSSSSAALANRPVRLYSDLLLHDLGPELAGVCGREAAPTEHRTARLMGLRYRDAYLHDGRAHTVRDAILFHGGEAAGARAAFSALTPADQVALVRFVVSR